MTENLTFNHPLFPNLFNASSLSEMFDSVNRNSLYTVNSHIPYNIIAKEKCTVVECALAGFKKEEIKIAVEGNELKITATKPKIEVKEEDEEKLRYEHHGIAFRDMRMSLEFGPLADKKGIKSTFINGLLTITIPVKEEEFVDISID